MSDPESSSSSEESEEEMYGNRLRDYLLLEAMDDSSDSHSEQGDGDDDEEDNSSDSEHEHETNLLEIHESRCRDGDGWSHAFILTYNHDECYNTGLSSNSIIDTVIHNQEEGATASQGIVSTCYTAENWSKMGEALSQSIALRTVYLFFCGLNGEHTAALFGNRTYLSRQKFDINLVGNAMGPCGMRGLIPFLSSRSSIRKLDLSNNNLQAEGARLLAEALNTVPIEQLKLRNNDFGDEGVEHLTTISVQSYERYLCDLDLEDNGIGRRGFEAIAQLLRRSGTNLTNLNAPCPDVENAQILVESLSNNTKFEFFGGLLGDSASVPLAQSMQTLICNQSSVESLVRSNHQLRFVGYGTTTFERNNPILKEALNINARTLRGASVVKRIRAKLRTFYFKEENENYSVQPFANMDVKLMPHVLELVTKTEKVGVKGARGNSEYYETSNDNVSGVYRLIRNCHMPELFCFPSPESTIRGLEEKIVELEKENAMLKAGVLDDKCECHLDDNCGFPNKRARTG